MAIADGLNDAQIANTLTASSVGSGTLAASAPGRAIMADDYFTTAEFVAGAGGKFATGCLDNTGLLNVVPANAFDNAFLIQAIADNAFAASAATRALWADDFWTSAEVSTVGAGGKFDAGCITAAGLAHLIVADGFDSTRVDALFAAGAFGATADARAAIADDFFTAAMVSDAGAGGKFAADCITTAGLQHLVAASSITSAVIVDIFNADAFDQATVNDQFAADCMDNANVQKMFAADAFGADANSRGAFVTDFINAATALDIIENAAIVSALIADENIDHQHLVQIADTAAGVISSCGADVVLKLLQPDGADGDIDFTLPATLGNVEIIDCWVRPTDTNGANANTTQLQTAAAGAITDAISTNGVADGGIVRATSMNEANSEIASGGTLRIRRTKIAGNVAADVFVRLIKRA